MHLVGFIVRIYRDARSSECQIDYTVFNPMNCKTLINKHLPLMFPVFRPLQGHHQAGLYKGTQQILSMAWSIVYYSFAMLN
jgi:hypothetical protein